MKVLLSLLGCCLSLQTFANVQGMRCDLKLFEQTGLAPTNYSFNIPLNTNARKITYMVSETTLDHLATYNTTVNLFVNADDSGLKIVSVKAWPDGGAVARSYDSTSASIFFPSRLDKHSIEASLNCKKFNADYLLISQFSFKDDDFLNVPSVTLENFFEFAEVEDTASYARAVAHVQSITEFAAKEFCYIGDVQKLMSDLKRSLLYQIRSDGRAGNYPSYWERSEFNRKTLVPENLVYNEVQNEISWSQPRETQVCTKSHNETINNSDSGMDEEVEVCDNWAPQRRPNQFNQIKTCSN